MERYSNISPDNKNCIPVRFDGRLKGGKLSERSDSMSLLKRGVWLYFLLLIFEGALRKWFLPGLATPLLIVRDPVAIWLIISAYKQRLFPANPYVLFMAVVGVIGIYTAVFFGHGNLIVAIYGARVMFFHFPLIFVIGGIFNRDDVVKMGKVTLWIAIPMTLLIALQFHSPQSAWVNRGVGGDMAGAGFRAIDDYFRPPGTFSFTNGTTLFYGFVASFIFYFWVNSKDVNYLVLICATAALLAAVPLSISRGLFFQTGISLIFAIIAISRKPKYLGRMILAIIGGLFIMLILGRTSFFQTASHAFTGRFEVANEQEGGLKGVLGDRYMGGMITAVQESLSQPFFGHGLGMGTNVGSMLLANKKTFLIAEEEWARIIGELGPLMGLAMIFIRLSLSLKLALSSYKKLRAEDFLPWMLLSFGLLTLTQANWGQPTSLGFSILVSGLTIAALNDTNNYTGKSFKNTK